MLTVEQLFVQIFEINFVFSQRLLNALAVDDEQRLTHVPLTALQVMVGKPGIEAFVVFLLQFGALLADALHLLRTRLETVNSTKNVCAQGKLVFV